MASITPYQISIPEEQLFLLSQKLSLTTFPKTTIHEQAWSRGPPPSEIKRLVSYWQKGFSWREVEAHLNATLPQFTTSISVSGFGDYEMHFVHQRSEVHDAIPLLYLHGWPGSFLEVQKLLPLLVKGSGEQKFHVVAPSLIDFGFSAGNMKVCLLFLVSLSPYTVYVNVGTVLLYLLIIACRKIFKSINTRKHVTT